MTRSKQQIVEKSEPLAGSAGSRVAGRRLAGAAASVLAALVIGALGFAAGREGNGLRPVAHEVDVGSSDFPWSTLMGLRESLDGVDIAQINLLAATGLAGAEQLDLEALQSLLDQWADRVKSETERHLYRFKQSPSRYQDSEAYFRMLMLIVVLQEDFGIAYNPARVHTPDYRDSRDLFIHGLLDRTGEAGEGRGTCVSMPVTYVAVGRRLGYPLKLVVTKGHVFARWDAGPSGERFNIEGTNRGLRTPNDDYYEQWPHELTEEEIADGWYLRSLEPNEELALFLQQRGHCLEDNGRFAGAHVAYALAHQVAPTCPSALGYLAQSINREIATQKDRNTIE